MRTIRRTSQTAAICRWNGGVFEELAASALEQAGFTDICNLNHEVKTHFPYADILAKEDGVWYAISVKGRHKIMLTGRMNNRYKLDMSKAERAVNELRTLGYECVPAWAAVEINGDLHTVFFGRMHDSARKNGIGMNESEKAAYRRLVADTPHNRRVWRNVYEPL